MVGSALDQCVCIRKSDQTVLKDVFAPQRPPDRYREEFGVELVLRRKTILANARRGILKQIINQLDTSIFLLIEIVHGTAASGRPRSSCQSFGETGSGIKSALLEGIGHMPHHVAKDVIDAIDRAAARADCGK